MKSFSQLYRALDATTKTSQKIAAMVDYFQHATPGDASWAVYFLNGNRLSRVLPPRVLRQWSYDRAGIPAWLFEESYQSVGDLAETISLLVPAGEAAIQQTLQQWVQDIQEFRGEDESRRVTLLDQLWQRIPQEDAFVLAKMITGGMRVGVSRRLVVRAISEAFGLSTDQVAHRMMGQWEPTEEFFRMLIDPDQDSDNHVRPYPFCLAQAVEQDPTHLGNPQDYLAEWKWDGIRLQLIRRQGETLLWSRGEERIEDRFPEIVAAATSLPEGTVIDGELLAWRGDQPLGFLELQRRINRKKVGKKLMQDVPVRMLAFDVLESDGVDIRNQPLQSRRMILESLFDHPGADGKELIQLSTLLEFGTWEELGKSRAEADAAHAEGVMIKSRQSAYLTGRVTGAWWKWKTEPSTIDAVLIYAQRGHGRRASLYTDYTFALWEGEQLVPFAKAYSGLTDAEIRKVDRFIRDNTRERFGPVRSVEPELVMELAFEKVQASKRHKSGVAVRFPRILRWRQDKTIQQANHLADLKEMAGLETVDD